MHKIQEVLGQGWLDGQPKLGLVLVPSTTHLSPPHRNSMGKKKGRRSKKGVPSAATASSAQSQKKKTPEELRALPQKESNVFKNIIKMYETKQYKKGVKFADSILKNFPDHGETLAMKGLTLNCLGKKEEAHKLVRQGLANDMKSHVCWHVYGLLYRSERDYNQAIRSYKNALRIDPKNLQILRDLSLLQIQMRNLEGFKETRRTLLQLKSNNRNNWVGFAIAQHLCGALSQALAVFDSYRGTLDEKEKNSPSYEVGEMMLYANEIMQEGGDLDAALTHLDGIQHVVKDRLSWMERKALLLCLLKRFKEAESMYRYGVAALDRFCFFLYPARVRVIVGRITTFDRDI
jgi:peptide alpha-N-acetyltransferase